MKSTLFPNVFPTHDRISVSSIGIFTTDHRAGQLSPCSVWWSTLVVSTCPISRVGYCPLWQGSSATTETIGRQQMLFGCILYYEKHFSFGEVIVKQYSRNNSMNWIVFSFIILIREGDTYYFKWLLELRRNNNVQNWA